MTRGEKGYTPRLKIPKTQGKGTKHGVWTLDKLLKCDLDRRLAIVKKRDQIEADYISHVGGSEALTPSMISLIKRIVHAELVAAHVEKMALAGEFDLTDKAYGALASRQERHIKALEDMIKDNTNRQAPSLEDYLQQKAREQDEKGKPKK